MSREAFNAAILTIVECGFYPEVDRNEAHRAVLAAVGSAMDTLNGRVGIVDVPPGPGAFRRADIDDAIAAARDREWRENVVDLGRRVARDARPAGVSIDFATAMTDP